MTTRIITLAFLIVMMANPAKLRAQAGGGGIKEEKTAVKITGTSNNPPVSITLQPANITINDYGAYPEPASQQNKTIKNIISFGIREKSSKYISADFTASVELKIEYGHTPSPLQTVTKTFQINYKIAEGEKFNAEQYFSFDGYEYVKVTVNTVTAPAVGSLDTREVLEVKNVMHITRYLELPAISPVPTFSAPVAAPDQLTVSWTWDASTTGNNATQLEWAWLENELETEYFTGGSLDKEKLFRNNSTRVDLDHKILTYDIPLLYDGHGKLYYRIRAVNIKPITGTRSEGNWAESPYSLTFDGHNEDLNWQATTTFAEEGKRKSVVQYFDGSLRGRQTVTKDNSTNTIVSAETMYDREGRAVVQILPTPGISNIIQYQQKLNMFNGQSDTWNPADIFDLQPATTPGLLTLDVAYGASKYYSPLNPNNTGLNKNIPDAEGYPYTITRYMPDATGRVMAQSGIGANHQLGSGHETRYYYSTPAQEELDGLFGTETGNFTHYSKTAVRDANGQVSVSYTDMHGRTVATALAGESPASLQALNIANNDLYPGQAGTPITRNLLDPATNLVKGNSIESVSTLMVVKDNTTHHFSYKLNDLQLQLNNCPGIEPEQLCYSCRYNLEIVITNDEGTSPPMVRKYTNISLTPGDDCSVAVEHFSIVAGNDALPADITTAGGVSTIAFDKTLNVGAYTIRKTLSVNETSLQQYKDLYLSKALCKTEEELIDSVKNVLLTVSNCAATAPPTCESCHLALGTFESFRNTYLTSIGITLENATAQLIAEIQAAYNTELESCNRLCTSISQNLPAIRQMMLQDMVPFTGQYAVETAPPGTATMYNKYNIFSTATPAITWQPFYKNPVKLVSGTKVKDYYYNDQAAIDAAIHPNTAPNQYTYLDGLSKQAFAAQFNNSWLTSLLPHHPEYARLVYAETNLTASYDWITGFTQTGADVGNSPGNAYLNPAANDPFFTIAPAYAAQMTAQIANYQGGNIGMWQLAYGDVKCKSINNVAQRTLCYQNAPNTPPPYTGFTAAENQQAWQIFRGLYAAKRNDFVNGFIAAQVPLPATDEADLLAQNYRLWFPKNNQQIAQQSGWNSWWPPVNTSGAQDGPLGIPPGNVLGGPAQTYDGRCSSYISTWTTALLQCQALAGHGDRDLIIAKITTALQKICVKGSDEANPFGSSTVNPSTPVDGSPRSFEEAINAILLYHHIDRTELCNSFVIEWPKPYGKNPALTGGGYTTLVDSCNCEQFKKIKLQAQQNSVDPGNLAALNTFLLAHYGEVLTDSLFAALQKCDGNICDCNNLHDVVTLYYQSYPGGGFVCNTIPAQLTVSSRTGNIPALYMANTEIEFIPGFDNPPGDQFDAFITDSTVCDSIAECRQNFVNFFNAYHGYNPPLTWQQIVALYTTNCGAPPNVCGYKDYRCETFVKLACRFRSSHDYSCEEVSSLESAFEVFFNNYYHNNPLLNFADIEELYRKFCGSAYETPGALLNLICSDGTTTVNCSLYECTNLPIILSQPQPVPRFLKCGAGPVAKCITCAGISLLTKEFKEQQFPEDTDWDYSTAPHFAGTNLTAQQVEENILYARFINYRTGFQFNWLDYAKALENATPACNLENYNSNTAASQEVICRDKKPLTDITDWPPPPDPCARIYNMAVHIAQQLIRIRKESLLQEFENSYRQKCLASAGAEAFTVQYQHSEYHYTLYYYDQAGNLVKTVPPKGVRPNFTVAYTNQVKQDREDDIFNPRPHELVTEYRYNSLNQVMAQHTPDAGLAKFWYDKLGRLVVSQNAKQEAKSNYSYTLYDALGRLTEVGQKQHATAMTQVISQNETDLNTWIKTTGSVNEQITRTVYDVEHGSVFNQQNLRNRVSYTIVKNFETDDDPYAGTFYSYDIHGNVHELWQNYTGLGGLEDGDKNKNITYEYDLISGKVNQVNYQPGQADAFYHRYCYDAENRLKEVETSRDAIYWETDARYTYYKHGPLARTVLGHQQVQGIDYAYTLQGWLKGMNSTAATYDMGQDGITGSSNIKVAQDVFGFALHYFDDGAAQQDYKPIGAATTPFARPASAMAMKNLYNGNIAGMTVNNAALKKGPAASTNSLPLFNRYQYDQLNRIVGMQVYKGLNESTNAWTPVALDDYKETVSYDPNGNILTYERNGSPAISGKPTAMDNMEYEYITNTNKLKKVTDQVANSNYTEDIDDQGLTDNYVYDEIGNLMTDLAEGIDAINWNVYGKISSINKSDGTAIDYGYDAGGNRIWKQVAPAGGTPRITLYVRDAGGNVMSVYEKEVSSESLPQTETHLYGSSRLGLAGKLTVAPVKHSSMPGDGGDGWMSTFTRGEKLYELSNHLGNVLATITDRKIAVDGNTDGIIDYYTADVTTANDYYPFGMQMPGRKYQSATAKYRYGFNGKEQDPETYGEGNIYDYGFRIYNPRLGKFLSVDPLTRSYPWYTPYQFAGNKPIIAIDLDGLEEEIVIKSFISRHKPIAQVATAITMTDRMEARKAAIDFIIQQLQMPEIKNPQEPRTVMEHGAMGELSVKEQMEAIRSIVEQFTIWNENTSLGQAMDPKSVIETYSVFFDFNYSLFGNKQEVDDIKNAVKKATTVIEYASNINDINKKLPKFVEDISTPSSIIGNAIDGNVVGMEKDILEFLGDKGLDLIANQSKKLAPWIKFAKSNPFTMTLQFTFANSAPEYDFPEKKEANIQKLKNRTLAALLLLFQTNNKSNKIRVDQIPPTYTDNVRVSHEETNNF